jgi:hypothetical protein
MKPEYGTGSLIDERNEGKDIDHVSSGAHQIQIILR